MLTLRPDRIRARLDALGLNENRAAELATGGKNRDLVRKVLEGKQQKTNYTWTLSLAAVLQCSVEYLSGASDIPGKPQAMPPDIASAGQQKRERRRSSVLVAGQEVVAGVAKVLEYDVQLSAGPGSLITDEDPRAEWGLPRSFLAAMRLSADNLAIVSIVGESMEPLLRDGDIVMLDLQSRNPALPGIYALWEGSATVCKRVEIVHGADPPKLRIMSVNPAYSTYEILAEEANVIGRVAWFGRRT